MSEQKNFLHILRLEDVFIVVVCTNEFGTHTHTHTCRERERES